MGSVLCCAGTTAASCCTNALCSCAGSAVPSSVASRAGYAVIFILWSVIAWVMSHWAYDILKFVPVLKECVEEQTCYGAVAVYRICFALALFHFIHTLGMIGTKTKRDCRVGLQNGFWFIKFLALAVLTVLAFLIPNSFFIGYGWVSLFGAALFLLVQLVLLVEFAYAWNDSWLENWGEGDENKGWYYALLLSSLLMFLGFLALTVVYYIFFSMNWENVVFVTINMLAVIIFSGLSVNPQIQEANPGIGLLQSSVVALYSTYLVGSAMLSESDVPSEFSSNTGGIVILILGVVLAIAAVCFSTVRTASGAESISGRDEESQALTENAHESVQDDDEDADVDYNYSYFHLAFCLGAMYIGHMLTNWQLLHKDSHDSYTVDTGVVAVWVKIVSSWLVILLYIWSIIAPTVLPDREWGH